MSEVLAGQVLHLQWNAYTSTWGPVLRDLRAAGLFHDLTLVTADNQLVTAHKIVLAACSQFFRGLLASLPMQTTGPLSPAVLYMRGVTGAALLKLLDFMYNGEVNVEQQLLKEFLQLGEELRVQGLCEEVVEKGEKVEEKSVVSKPKEKERKDGGGSGAKERHRSYSGKEKVAHSEKVEKKSKSNKENVTDYNDVAVERVVGSRKEFSERKALKREAEEGERKAMKREIEEGERKALKREAEEGERKSLKREADEEVSVIRSEAEMIESPVEELEMGHDKDDRMLGDKDRTRTPTPRKKIRKLKSLEELKDDTINRDVLTMDPGEAHGILKLIENLDDIEENSEDLNIFVQLLNQLILKSNIANNVLYFCGICQKSLKSKQHMANHVEANHVVGVFHICSECGVKMKTRSSLFSHKNKNHKIQKKEAPEVRGDLVQNKTELPTMADSLLTKADPVLNRPEFTQRKIEDVQNNFSDSINMSEHNDAHNAEEINHYSSETEFE
eukprot:TRINITY_DN755_c0_g1_i1.p1 TRINITY_DN755_c0_g1~~TRINITY_DN755_c0_g1_i1.p1  ORF type:complete len:501 (-),score=197.13 TRINITY_DN755_c0_g1_i1:168-1670(-)